MEEGIRAVRVGWPQAWAWATSVPGPPISDRPHRGRLQPSRRRRRGVSDPLRMKNVVNGIVTLSGDRKNSINLPLRD
jgi:hypothetical protein